MSPNDKKAQKSSDPMDYFTVEKLVEVIKEGEFEKDTTSDMEARAKALRKFIRFYCVQAKDLPVFNDKFVTAWDEVFYK